MLYSLYGFWRLTNEAKDKANMNETVKRDIKATAPNGDIHKCFVICIMRFFLLFTLDRADSR